MNNTFELAFVAYFPDSVNHLNDYEDIELDAVSKSGYHLALTVMQFMNATPTLVVSDKWGSQISDGNWTGMLGDFVSGRSEFGATPALVSTSRQPACDYTSYSVKTGTAIVFRAPKLSYTTNVFLLPFDRDIWTCAFLLLVLVGCVLMVTSYYEWEFLVPAGVVEPSREMLANNVSDVFCIIMGSVVTQGSPCGLPQNTAGRVAILFCLVFIVCLYISYSAFIVALLQSSSNNIRTVKDLYDSYMPVGNEDTAYSRYWVKRLTDPMDQLLYEKRILNKDGTENFMSLEEGVLRMQKGLFALHMETPVGYRLIVKYFSEPEKCDLREVPFADIQSPYFVTRKYTVFKEVLRIG